MIKYFTAMIFILILSSCSDDNSSSANEGSIIGSEVPEGLDGFVSVTAAGKSVFLGSNETSARPNERPRMNVKFDYDFYLGEHEVTCGEVSELANERWGKFAKCESAAEKRMPIADVTYFDAVIYANLLSAAKGFDTSYVYSAATFNAEGHCVGLDGLIQKFDVDGFRLPTEAEWVFVASRFWNVENCWNSENSNYESHEVCSLRKEGDYFCDLAGNVMEWTGDWLGLYRDSAITNYVGAPESSRGERVVKGGSFRSDKASMQLSSRGSIYLVTSSTHADYVGIRLAFGKIPDPVWMEDDGAERKSVIGVMASATAVRNKVGSYKSKLVFRDDETGNLAYIDFAKSSRSVVEIKDTIDAYHPDISPDGTKIAFSTGSEGTSVKSRLYVRDLNGNGAHLVQLNVESAAIPRWRVTAGGDTVIVYVANGSDNTNDEDFFAMSTWQVPFADGAFGTPEKLFDGAYHGGISADNRIAVTGSRLLRARIDNGTSIKDDIWYDGEQACNVSLAKDGSKRVAFMDFSGEMGNRFVGSNYGVHERLLIADSTGKLIQSVAAPDGYSFDHCEWADVRESEGFVVATLSNGNGSHQKIVLVDLSDSSVMTLAEGNELWHPALWATPAPAFEGDNTLNLDSAGVYLSEKHDEEQAEFRLKMELFWENLAWTNVLVVGSSRPQYGINPDVSENWNMLNVCVEGIDPNRDLTFVEGYAMNHSDNLKAIVISLDLDSWRGNENHYALIYGGAPGYIYDMQHNYWADYVPENFLTAVRESLPVEEYLKAQFNSHGFRLSQGIAWNSIPVEVHNDSVFNEKERLFFETQLDRLMKIVDAATEKEIYVVGVIFPQAPQYKETGSFGRYGLPRSEAEKKIAWLDSIAKERKYFVLMDENKMGDHDYPDYMAINMDHISAEGAEQITRRLDSLLNTLK